MNDEVYSVPVKERARNDQITSKLFYLQHWRNVLKEKKYLVLSIFCLFFTLLWGIMNESMFWLFTWMSFRLFVRKCRFAHSSVFVSIYIYIASFLEVSDCFYRWNLINRVFDFVGFEWLVVMCDVHSFCSLDSYVKWSVNCFVATKTFLSLLVLEQRMNDWL